MSKNQKVTKYQRWYEELCAKAKTRDIPTAYTEVHHIKPRSLGGSDDESNLVRLTVREHFICHRLLTRMMEGVARRKMFYALWAMSWSKNGMNRIVSARQFAIAKKARYEAQKLLVREPEYLAAMSARMSGKNNPCYGRVMTPELRAKISATSKITRNLPEERMKGAEAKRRAWANPELRARASLRAKSQPPISEETRAKLSKAAKGRRQTAEDRAKKSEAAKRRPPMSEETRAKLRSPKSPEHRAKLRIVALGRERKLTADNVLEIRRLAPFHKQKDLCARFNISSGMMSSIITRRCWNHI